MWSIRCVACVALRCAERARVVEASLGALGEACPRASSTRAVWDWVSIADRTLKRRVRRARSVYNKNKAEPYLSACNV